MSRNHPLIKIALLPFAVVYRMIVDTRNWLFNIGILRSRHFNIPVISVGNITVGGTGKTPHTEYIISLLTENNFSVAMLSRGYGRKTKGFVLADKNSDSKTIGDEPFQIKKKFKNNIIVAVDKKRVRGIENLLALPDKKIDVIVLDDAYQHRYVKPDINILLVDYYRLISKDYMLPMGNLREPVHNKKRANIVIVTKCPKSVKPINFRITTNDLKLYPYQTLFFTQYIYLEPIPVFGEKLANPINKEKLLKDSFDILLVTGIVSPKQLRGHLKRFSKQKYIHSINYPDHHDFTEKDIEEIAQKFSSLTNKNKVIITTEKDASRFLAIPDLPKEIKKSLYYIPIRVEFLLNKEQKFNEIITSYVRKNKPNSRISKK
jgi:tetraacyldisaccharide 4'-kinase